MPRLPTGVRVETRVPRPLAFAEGRGFFCPLEGSIPKVRSRRERLGLRSSVLGGAAMEEREGRLSVGDHEHDAHECPVTPPCGLGGH